MTRRRKEGAFYTPPFITRYIVEQALGGVLRDRLEALRQRHASRAAGTVRNVLQDPAPYDLGTLNRPQKTALVLFWGAWQEELRTIKVLDPACGSGAFLLEAFHQLHAAYEHANDQLEQLRGHRSLFDLDRHILQNNLFGVDLNTEAVEICRLSLWIKTAERGKRLTSLDETVRAGNSLISDSAIDARAFDWQAAFPQVFEDGGFDVVVGNPPYVRQEWLTLIKPYLKEHYRTYDGAADLYVYFCELGLRVLKPGGRLSYVVTNKWMRAGYGEPLRELLSSQSWMESVVDFGHAKQIFLDADVFPCIFVTRKPDGGNEPATSRVCSIPREQLHIEDLGQQIGDSGCEVPRKRLGSTPWSLEPPAVDDLLEKLRRAGTPLKDWIGARPLFGIKTGLNAAFLLDTAAKERLIATDPRSAELLRPYVRGQDIDRWQADWAGLWMLALKSSGDHAWPWSNAGEKAEAVFAAAYPAIHAHLNQFREALIKRQDQGRYWWELRSCSYWDRFAQAKIFYQDITWQPQACLDTDGMLSNNTVYFLPTGDPWLIAVLNLPIGWWFAWRKAQHGKDEALRFFTEFVEGFPIPRPSEEQQTGAAQSVSRLKELAARHQQGIHDVLNWLRVEYEISKPSQRMQDVTGLDLDSFVAEVRKLRGKGKPLSPASVRGLQDGFEATVLPLKQALAESAVLERRVSDCVNGAFGLSAQEVELMWKTAPPRMPIDPSAG